MAKRSLKLFGLGIGGLIVVVGILVGILFATGVIKVPSKDSSGPNVPKPDPLGPDVPNPYAGKEINVRLSNPTLQYGAGNGYNLPVGITYNIQYEPSPFNVGAANWELRSKVVLIFKSGKEEVVEKTDIGTVTINTFTWQDFIAGLGMKEVPVRAQLSATLSYTNKYGNTITGPESNKVSVDIPSNY